MATNDGQGGKHASRILVRKDGPYLVQGGVPLVRKVQIVSEYGEPLAWKKEGEIATGETYALCRCGHSRHRPFCDDSHSRAGFDGTETADTQATADRRMTLPGGRGIVVRSDPALCNNSGYCANEVTNIQDMVFRTSNTQVRAQVIAMIEHCPSGSLTYTLAKGAPDIEVDLPTQIATTVDITSDGPVEGALWVTGSVPVERADGKPFEARPRVTLCTCGRSRNKPLCDGTHRE
jgi:CDGSH-type Zn-finger protein